MALNNKWKNSRFVLLFSQSTQLLFREDVGDDYCECFSSLKGGDCTGSKFFNKRCSMHAKGLVELSSNNEWDTMCWVRCHMFWNVHICFTM